MKKLFKLVLTLFVLQCLSVNCLAQAKSTDSQISSVAKKIENISKLISGKNIRLIDQSTQISISNIFHSMPPLSTKMLDEIVQYLSSNKVDDNKAIIRSFALVVSFMVSEENLNAVKSSEGIKVLYNVLYGEYNDKFWPWREIDGRKVFIYSGRLHSIFNEVWSLSNFWNHIKESKVGCYLKSSSRPS